MATNRTIQSARGATETVAVYDDYRRAMAAVSELSKDSAPPGLHVALTDFDEVRVRSDSNLRHEIGRSVLPSIVGAFGAAVAAWLFELTADASFVVLAAAATAVGLVAAFVVAGVRVARAGGAVPIATTRQVPTRYEVRCAGDTKDVEHRLASWWATGLDGPAVTPGGRRLVHG